MLKLSKKFALVLIFILSTSGLLLVESCVAPVTVPANPKPGPEIASVVINNDPVWHPPLIITDPFTGEVTYSPPGYWIQNGTIELTIKNQPFTPYTDENGTHINIYYCVFIKDAKNTPNFATTPKRTVYQPNSDCTIITFTYNGAEIALPDIYVTRENAVLDFRIQAVTGYFVGTRPQYFDAVYEGEGSAFTEFSVKIPSTNDIGTSKPNIKPTSVAPSTSNPNNPPPQNTPQQLLQSNLIIILVSVCVIAILLIVIAYLLYKQKKTKQVVDTGEGCYEEETQGSSNKTMFLPVW
jgi:flagellar basal body-associated protein FliL